MPVVSLSLTVGFVIEVICGAIMVFHTEAHSHRDSKAATRTHSVNDSVVYGSCCVMKGCSDVVRMSEG